MNRLERMLSASGSRKCREGKGERKRKRNTRMMTRTMMMMTHITSPRTIMMTAEMTPSSGLPKDSSKKLTRSLTHK